MIWYRIKIKKIKWFFLRDLELWFFIKFEIRGYVFIKCCCNILLRIGYSWDKFIFVFEFILGDGGNSIEYEVREFVF